MKTESTIDEIFYKACVCCAQMLAGSGEVCQQDHGHDVADDEIETIDYDGLVNASHGAILADNKGYHLAEGWTEDEGSYFDCFYCGTTDISAHVLKYYKVTHAN